jgi:hypothetical protein
MPEKAGLKRQSNMISAHGCACCSSHNLTINKRYLMNHNFAASSYRLCMIMILENNDHMYVHLTVPWVVNMQTKWTH